MTPTSPAEAPHDAGRVLQRQCQAGFTYLGVLIAVALISLGTTAIAELWSKRVERERLARMDAIGSEYVAAIAGYYQGTPGIIVHTFPPTFEALLKDPRYVTVRRYLRREYPNPFTGRVDWEVIPSADGGIAGIHGRMRVDDRESGRDYIYRPPVLAPR